MAVVLRGGPRTWSGSRDDEGHREYKITHIVDCERADGPANAMQCPGLPVPGSPWVFGDDTDVWAWCRTTTSVTPFTADGAPNNHFEVTQTFSTKPPERDKQRCADQKIEDPLLEPPVISGSFVKFMEEATHDRFGSLLLTSSYEQIRGTQVEFDNNRPTIKISMNVSSLGLSLLSSLVDTVNGHVLWGLPPRTVKLSNVSWERKFHGQCYLYYTIGLEFDINFRTFDRLLLDEGTKVLNGHWDEGTTEWVTDVVGDADPDDPTPNPNPDNPTHFIRATDRNGEPMRVILNGRGVPFNPVSNILMGGEATPVLSCNPASSIEELELNRTYDVIDPPEGSHYFRVKSGGARGVHVEFAEMASIFGAESVEGVEIFFLDGACGATTEPEDPTFDGSGGISTIVPSVDTPYMVISVNNSVGSYTIRVSGLVPGSSPGQRLVQKYPSADFLLLGIPLSF